MKLINPITYTFNALRCNAKRRGKCFSLSLQEFKDFINGTDYMERKGQTSTSLSIDRIIPELGYVAGNLQLLTIGDNVRKHFVDEKILEYERQKLEGEPMTFNPDYL